MTAEEPLASLDVGSNTVRMLIVEPKNGRLERLADMSKFVRLGKGVDAAGSLQADRMDVAAEAIQSLVSEARGRGVEHVLAVATSAVRDARNGQEFARRIHDASGIDLRILSGGDEARLTALGALMDIALDGEGIVCDLGGGSAEVVLASEDRIEWGTSLPLGSGRLTERFVRHDPPREDEIESLETYVHAQLQALRTSEPRLAVLTGGTATHISVLAGYDDEIVHMQSSELRRIRDTINSLPSRSVIAKYGVAPERAQVLAAGVTALAALVNYFEIEQVAITRHGIREGVIVDFLQRESIWPSNRR